MYIRKNGDVATGSCCFTGSGRLPTKHVIHAVGPVWYAQRDKVRARKLLRRTIRSVYISAIKKKLTSLSIPPISGGIFGYPIELCAFDIITEIFRVAKIATGTLKLLRIVVIDIPTFQVFFRQFIKCRRDYAREINGEAKAQDNSASSQNSEKSNSAKSSPNRPHKFTKRRPPMDEEEPENSNANPASESERKEISPQKSTEQPKKTKKLKKVRNSSEKKPI